jgi:hypothetical protein
MNEIVMFYDFAGEKKVLEIEHNFVKKELKFGEKFQVEYDIINNNKEDVEITSVELKPSKRLLFAGTSRGSFITEDASLSEGKYMWVKIYKVKSESAIKIILSFQASTPGDAKIKFSVTSQDSYFKAKDITFKILQ